MKFSAVFLFVNHDIPESTAMIEPVSILIANWQGGEAIELCIESILKRTRHIPYDILVFDSTGVGSKEREYLLKQRDAGKIRLITKETCWTHCDALWVLIKNCSTKWACFLDSDIEVLCDDWLKVLFDQLKIQVLGIAKFDPPLISSIDPKSPYYHTIGHLPLFRPYCMLLNLPLYEKIAEPDDWSDLFIPVEEFTSKQLWNHLIKSYKQFWLEDITHIFGDLGWRFTEKIDRHSHLDIKFGMYNTPSGFWETKLKHYGSMSHPEGSYSDAKIQELKKNQLHEAVVKLRSEFTR